MSELAGRLMPLTPMRRSIGSRMSESKRDAPHFYVQAEVRIDAAIALIEDVTSRNPDARVTLTAAFVRACAIALRAEPSFNCVWTPAGLLRAESINVGVALALEGGLLAPALLGSQELNLLETARALNDLTTRARSGKLRSSEIANATFTLSNLGMYDVTAFTAIITPPQVAILATARPVERVVISADGLRLVSVMTVTLSADHRAVNGVDAARFLAVFKTAIEEPHRLNSISTEDCPEEVVS